MNLSEPFIRRPVMTAVLTLSVILFGLLSYWQLPVNDLPAVDYPVIQVQVGYPGASPDTVANNIATPLERQFMQINGLEVVTSQSTQGFASLTLQFDLDKNIDAAATDVQTAISQATGSLPPDLPSPPTYSKSNPNDQSIMYIALTSDSVTQGQLYNYASTQVGQRISILPGVSQVLVFGTKSAIRIKANPSAMWARGISIDDLNAAIRSGTSTIGAGQLDSESGTAILRPQGQLETPDQYSNLIVGGTSAAPVFLRDVATVKESVQDERVNMRFWVRGYDVPSATVIVAVNRRAGANAVEVSKSIYEILPTISAELPGSIRITPIYDRSQTIVHSVSDVRMTLIIAFVLVVMVIFAFLGRATDTLIPTVALPLSLLITFIAMNALGYSLDNLSLMALTLAIGFLVDDAIVFLENTVRRMERGEKPFEASINSAKEISFTIMSMTISLAAVFIPLVFMSGLVGRIFREFAVTIVIAILASGLVSLTLTPLMCARLLQPRGEGAKKTWMERVIGGIERRVLSVYGGSLWWFLRHRWISLMIWVACLAGTIGLFVIVPKSFLPPGDSSVIWGAFIAAEGSSPQQMQTLQDRVDKTLQQDPNVVTDFTLTGATGFLSANQGIVFTLIKPPDQRRPIAEVTAEMMGRLNTIPGLMTFLRPFPVLEISTGVTSQTQGQYAFAVSGANPQEVYEAGQKLMAKLMEYPGFLSVSSDFFSNTPSLSIDIRREQAKTYGVSEARILTLLRNAYSQNYLYLIKKPEDQYQVILEIEDSARENPEDLSLLYIKSDDGQRLVPLSELVTWKTTLGPQAVNHLNQFTSMTLFFNLKPGVPLGDATNHITNTAAEVVPPGVRTGFQGEAQTFAGTVTSMTYLMGLAVFVMYVILAILYESYVHPLTVLSTLPTALVGGLLTLLVFGQEASLYAFVGMFMLMGIVKKNGILIVDFARQRVEHGEAADKAIHDASMDRFRPILMTTLAAVFGALPIALGYGADGSSRQPLGLVVVGGLVVSQFITLYITPVIYLYLEQFQENVLDRTSFFRSRRSQAPTARAPTKVLRHPVLETRSRTIGLHSLGFLVVTLAAYLSTLVTMGYVLNGITPPRATGLISLALVYLANGIYGYAWIRNAASLRSSLLYFAIQIGFAVTLLFLTKSPAIMIAMLPLAGQSVVILPRRLMLGVCVTMWLALVVPMLISAGPGAAAVLGMFFLAGIVFVVVITQLAVKEQRARAEVERLLVELKDANDKLRDYADQVEEVATLTERNRLAREIHDSLGHYLTVVIVQIEAATAVMETDRESSLDGLRKAQALAQKGLADVRRSITALRTSQIEPRSLIESLKTLFEECINSGVAIDFHLLGKPRKLSSSAELTLYRAAQEGLTNVRKHSRANAARVTLDYSEDRVWLLVRDEGIGSNQPEKGFGLVGVHERVQLLGGEVKIATAPNKGFSMEVGLPG